MSKFTEVYVFIMTLVYTVCIFHWIHNDLGTITVCEYPLMIRSIQFTYCNVKVFIMNLAYRRCIFHCIKHDLHLHALRASDNDLGLHNLFILLYYFTVYTVEFNYY